ncbi:MAG: hypothetical protein EXR74_08920 [Bdellovibrionales bacterium]|nr:hypothetical protein [Bdellovibrionales bacterium]
MAKKNKIKGASLLLLALAFLFEPYGMGKVKDDHEGEKGGNNKENAEFEKRVKNPKSNEIQSGECSVNPGDIARFANGESYNFSSVVNLVAGTSCSLSSKSIIANEISQGINFNKIPFHLDNFSVGYSNLTIDSRGRMENIIQKNVAATLRNYSLSNSEILPVLGQLALLSPKAARSTLAYLITQELMSQEFAQKKGLREGTDFAPAVDILSSLKNFGADEPLIVAELSKNIEEMAINSQSDSLGKILAGLALAAREMESFSLAFNSSAGAFNRGVKQSIDQYTRDEQNNLLKSAFLAANASVGYSPSIEPGTQELNEALKVLLGGKTLSESSLKNLWKGVVEVAAASSAQTALATAFALSLTSQAIDLPKQNREKIMECAEVHPIVAVAVQEVFIEAWQEARQRVLAGKTKVGIFNERKVKVFEPWVSLILNLQGGSIQPKWLQEVVIRGLVKDKDIEEKFPRFVLALMATQEKSNQKAILESGVDPVMQSALVNFNALWNLSTVHLPALDRWASRQEEE